ncbi:MAG: CCA tRNA nucleotidyltransferase [Kiritimatiellae bacterium]|nr:CCA tRNA nucleotidyltransferase [Kiritimatiellia bacterium]
MQNDSPLAEGAGKIVSRLRRAGFQALFAGGCVRDMLLGREPKDFDVATDAPPDRVQELFPRSFAVGKAFGVVRVGIRRKILPGKPSAAPQTDYYEVATFRADGVYRDGRHPQSVVFADERADAARRDFTINAMFFDPVEGKVRDYAGGREDLEKKIIRAVGEPDQRFRDDHLRLLRAVRFAATFDFTIESGTALSIKQNAPLIGRVSAERIRQELTRILLEARRPGDALEMMNSLGLLHEILPELEAMRGQEQPPQFHPEGDVWTHTVMMLNASAASPPAARGARLAYAVLLHDVGKPATARRASDRIRFNRHAECGAVMAAAILQRLRLPSADIKAVSYIIGNHMRFMEVRRMRKSTLRRLVTAATFPDELELHRLDCAASHGDMQNYVFLTDFMKKFKNQPVLPPPLITGRDIIALGVPPGPAVGQLKKNLYDAQLEGRFAGRAAALRQLKKELTVQN